MNVTLTRELKRKDPSKPVLPAGTTGTLTFNNTTKCLFTASNGEIVKNFPCYALPAYFNKDFSDPTLSQLEEWSSDGICETVTGERTEPDGYGPDGSPSWLLAKGLI